MKTAHDVKLLNGSKQEVTYLGKETVTMPGTDGQDKVFTAGAPLDNVEVPLDFSSGGNQNVEVPEGYVARSAVIQKPEGAEQLIAKGETVAGIVGEYVTPGTAKDITPDFSGGDQTVAAEGDERWNSVTFKKPETLVPENIVEGVEIAGITGTLKNQKAPHQIIDGTVSSIFTITDDLFDSPPTSIKYAFSNNTKLFGVDLSQVSAIANYCFQGCTGLAVARLPALKSVTTNAFSNCRLLMQLQTDNVLSIGQSAFCSCYYLQNASFPLCTSIGSYAFYSCSSMQTIFAPSCKFIGPRAFYGCGKLQSAVFPLVSQVGLSAFYSCFALSLAFLPMMSAVATYGFYSCTHLESIYLLSTSVIPIYSYAFTGTPMYKSTYISKFGSIFVRESLVDAYKASASWSALASRIVGMTDDEIEALKTELGVQ